MLAIIVVSLSAAAIALPLLGLSALTDVAFKPQPKPRQRDVSLAKSAPVTDRASDPGVLIAE